MIAWSMQREAKGVTVLFSVCFFLFLCMFVEEFKIFPWAGKAFCFYLNWSSCLESLRALSLIPAGALVNLLQDLPTKPDHVKIKSIYPNISGLRLVKYIFQFILFIFCIFCCCLRTTDSLAILFQNAVAWLFISSLRWFIKLISPKA